MAIAAMIYDFDRTLSPKDMQEYSFIPHIGMDAPAFWAECQTFAKQHKADRILAYMYKMLEKTPLTRNTLMELGREIEYFPGVTDWFQRINAFGKSLGIEVEHYIISSGLREIIEGTSIAHEFKEIFAAFFVYDEQGRAVWPAAAVNYTSKTQFLFRINKGILDVTEDQALNEYTPDERRRIPFSHMIYIGDGLTDVPCMKLVKRSGGISIGVYQESAAIVDDMLFNGRVDFVLSADYRSGSPLEQTVRAALMGIAAQSQLNDKHIAHLDQARRRAQRL